MQKFRDYIYCDISKMNSYISQIPELSKIETSGSYEKTTSVDGEGKLVVAKFGTTLNEKNSRTCLCRFTCRYAFRLLLRKRRQRR